MNWGVRADVSTTHGRHNVKYGLDIKQTRLLENFGFGITDPTFNSPCIDADGAPSDNIALTNPNQCARAGLQPNIDTNPNATRRSRRVVPFDLTRNGTYSRFTGHTTSTSKRSTFRTRLPSKPAGKRRIPRDHYDGLVTKTEPQPRLGLAYRIKRSERFCEQPTREHGNAVHENLLLSSATGVGGLASNVSGRPRCRSNPASETSSTVDSSRPSASTY